MRIRRIRFREEYRLKGRVFIVLTVLLGVIFIPRQNRALMASYFSNKCRNYQQVFSRRLNDRVVDYSAEARLTGIEKCNSKADLEQRISAGQLVRIRTGSKYIVEDLKHSYPYLTRESRKLLNEISRRFRAKTGDDGLKGSKFFITSLTRTSEMIKGLGRTNGNVSENSPHLNGNAFDISYARFSIIKYNINDCDLWYMKEALAQVIFELRKENRCWATYERQQGCFHVVAK
jgi:hypothetical protein